MLYFFMSFFICSSVLECMEPRDRLFLVCPWRSTYRKNPQQKEDELAKLQSSKTFCVFCDEESLKNNQIFERNKDFIVMHNKHPYDGDIIHFLVMPTKHIEDLTSTTLQERAMLGNVISSLIEKFGPYAYGYKIGLNNGKSAGASISHIHWHVIFHRFMPCSLPERVATSCNYVDGKAIFNKVLDIYHGKVDGRFEPIATSENNKKYDDCSCYICETIHNKKNDDFNLVFYRSENFVVHFAHFPERVAQVCITPTSHGKINQEHNQELYYLQNTMIPILLKTVNEQVRSVGSFNIQISGDEHQYILITPRCNIPQSIIYLDGTMGYHPADYKQLCDILNNALNKGM